jgi:hypothetical protein
MNVIVHSQFPLHYSLRIQAKEFGAERADVRKATVTIGVKSILKDNHGKVVDHLLQLAIKCPRIQHGAKSKPWLKNNGGDVRNL